MTYCAKVQNHPRPFHLTNQPRRFTISSACPSCDSTEEVERVVPRTVQTFYALDVHMLTCRTCGKSWCESFSFLPHPQARITKAFTRLLLKFRESMSITDAARDFGVDWRCVKDAEKESLAEKYKVVSLEGVEAITIDEMYLFPHGRRILERMRESNMQLSDAHALKESLRSRYRLVRHRPSLYQNVRRRGGHGGSRFVRQC